MSAAVVTAAAPEAVLAGLRLKKAIDQARDVLTPLGFCASQEVFFHEKDAEKPLDSDDEEEEEKKSSAWSYRNDSEEEYLYEEEEKDEDEDDEDEEEAVDNKEEEAQAAAIAAASERRPPALRRTKRVKLVRQVNGLKDQFFRSRKVSEYSVYDSKIISPDMTLKVTRPGCEYDGPIINLSIHGDLARFHQHGSPSAYGDVQTMQTVVDSKVRSARELTTSEFSVSDNVLQLVVNLWQNNFWPSAVRAEAYKINVYGPGDFFDPHQDTPAQGLVGTLLLGLGDSSDGIFYVGSSWWSHTYLHSWAAFYPSVVHSVKKLGKGYRATLAFKIYTVTDQAQDELLKSEYMQEELLSIPRPFGLLLDYQYAVATTQMQGWDALVCHALESLAESKGIKVRRLSVITTVKAKRWDSECGFDEPSTCDTAVYAFDDEHIQLALAGKRMKSQDTVIAWRQLLPENVPFYTHQKLSAKGTVWSRAIDQGALHTGNESRAWDEKSVYLHWAVIVS